MDYIVGDVLDYILSLGFYRFHKCIFTTTEVVLDDESNIPKDVFWLRTNLLKVTDLKSHKIYKKNKQFNIQITNAIIDNEIENLYQKYKSNLTFEPSNSVWNCLQGNEEPKCDFDTKMIQIRDGQKLIACGYFDIGLKTLAGIMNFYDPDYKKYSLSKYMMLLKMEFGILNNMEYYYPGYIVLNSTRFDYKIFPNEEAMEVFLFDEKKWEPYQNYQKEGLAKMGYWAFFS
ncbi:MAG: arginine-tRNA-protein transferase [Candidatus Methylacidiphilales bacterium]